MANNIIKGVQDMVALRDIPCADLPLVGIVGLIQEIVNGNPGSFYFDDPFPSLTQIRRGYIYRIVGISNGDATQFFASKNDLLDASQFAAIDFRIVPYAAVNNENYNRYQPDIQTVITGNYYRAFQNTIPGDTAFIRLKRTIGTENITFNVAVTGSIPEYIGQWINFVFRNIEGVLSIKCLETAE